MVPVSYRARFNNNPETLLVELVCSIDERLEHLERLVHRLISKPTSITFKEISMNPTAAGQTQVFTGTLAPAGAVFPSDSVFTRELGWEPRPVEDSIREAARFWANMKNAKRNSKAASSE